MRLDYYKAMSIECKEQTDLYHEGLFSVLRFHLLVIRAIVGNDNLPLDGLFAQLLMQSCHQVVTTAVENRYKYGERMVHYKR